MDGLNLRTNGESKAIQTKISPRSIHIYTHKKGKRGKINISCFQSPPPQFWDDLLCIQVFQDAGYIKLILEI